MKISDGVNWNGTDNVFAYGSMIGLVEVDSSMVKVTSDSEDVVNCNVPGTLWLVQTGNDLPTCLYTIKPRTSYACVTTANRNTARMWEEKK